MEADLCLHHLCEAVQLGPGCSFHEREEVRTSFDCFYCLHFQLLPVWEWFCLKKNFYMDLFSQSSLKHNKNNYI